MTLSIMSSTLGHIFYNPRSANPFIPGIHPEWTSNNLILKDADMRVRAGVTVLDNEVTQGQVQQHGGGATSAPFFIKNYGSPKATTYDQVQSGGGFPRHYFDNNKQW